MAAERVLTSTYFYLTYQIVAAPVNFSKFVVTVTLRLPGVLEGTATGELTAADRV